MKKERHASEQIVKKLRSASASEEPACGTSIEEVCRKLEVSVATCQRWNEDYSGVMMETVRRLKELEHKNARFKKLVAEQALDMDMLEEIKLGKWQARPAAEKL